VASWETYDPNLDEQYDRNFVLKQPSTVGPWVACGLGVILLAFLGSLVYVNLLLPPSPSVSLERSLRPEAELASSRSRPKRSTQRSLERRKKTITVVPQGRAPNALLGGQGPALPPEHGAPVDTPRTSRVSPQTLSGRQ
jgi:hypothetical protein